MNLKKYYTSKNLKPLVLALATVSFVLIHQYAYCSGQQEASVISFGDKVISASMEGVSSKVDPELIKEMIHNYPVTADEVMNKKGKTNSIHEGQKSKELKILIYMKEQVDTKTISDFVIKREDKAKGVIKSLKENAQKEQKQIKDYLEAKKVSKGISSYKSFWVINALSVTVNDIEVIKELSQRKDVARIAEDKIIEPPQLPMISESRNFSDLVVNGMTWGLDKIKVQNFWEEGWDGEGIIVANMDTGVDVNHPDLQGKMENIGDGSLGWYDPNSFVHHPVDTNGHGTHTMGTMVGGNANSSGINIGVAPQSKYYAVRIFGQQPAYESVILDGGQWILDPDNNPETADCPDIVNNSWGSTYPGYTDEWFRLMVNNWRNAGILPVFASGNAGEYLFSYYTASAPGNYPESYSVGATDQHDDIASFSSKGSAKYDGVKHIKPNISAPGVDVISAHAEGTDMYHDGEHFYGGDLYICNGTSMAAPHVAGAAALIKQKHPEWSLNEVEAYLSGTSKDIKKGVLAQGAGRLNLLRKEDNYGVILEGSAYMGENLGEKGVWLAKKNLTLKNISNQTVSYKLYIDNNFPKGVSCSVNPKNITLKANGQASVSLQISVNNEIVSFTGNNGGFYDSNLIVKTISQGNMKYPISFSRGTGLNILAPGHGFLVIHNQNETGTIYQGENPYVAQFIFVPEGSYDVWAGWRNFPNSAEPLVIRENIAVDRLVDVVLQENEATNLIHVDPTNYNGNEIGDVKRSQAYSINHNNYPNGFAYIYFGYPSQADTLLSDVSDEYTWYWEEIFLSDDAFHSIGDYADEGIYSSLTFQNTPDDFRHLAMTFHPSEKELAAVDEGFPIIEHGSSEKEMDASFTEHYYIETQPRCQRYWPFQIYANGSMMGHEILRPIHISRIIDDEIRLNHTSEALFDGLEPYHVITSDHVDFGYGPDHIHTTFNVDDNKERVQIGRGRSDGYIGVVGAQLGSKRFLPLKNDKIYGSFRKLYFELWHDNIMLSESYFMDFLGPYEANNALPEIGEYELKVFYEEFFVKDRKGLINASYIFDTSKEDTDLPYMDYFNILSNGNVTDHIVSQDDNSIEFGINDDIKIQNVNAKYSISDLSEGEFQLAIKDNKYYAEIPSNLSSKDSYVSIEVTAIDHAGNVMRQKISPSFFYDTGVPHRPLANIIEPYDGKSLNGYNGEIIAEISDDDEIVGAKWCFGRNDTPCFDFESDLNYDQIDNVYTDYWEITSEEPDGEYQLCIEALDTYGLVSRDCSDVIIERNSANSPDVVIEEPYSGKIITGTNGNIIVDAVDSDGIQSVKWCYAEGDIPCNDFLLNDLVYSEAQQRYIGYWDTEYDANGDYLICSKAVDELGCETSVCNEVSLDYGYPGVVISAPSPNTFGDETEMTVTYELMALATVNYYLDDALVGSELKDPGEGLNYTFVNLAPGEHHLKVQAVNAYGEEEDTVIYTVNLPADIEIISPPDNSEGPDTLIVSYSINQYGMVSILLDADYVEGSASWAGIYEHSFSNLSEGEHNIRITFFNPHNGDDADSTGIISILAP